VIDNSLKAVIKSCGPPAASKMLAHFVEQGFLSSLRVQTCLLGYRKAYTAAHHAIIDLNYFIIHRLVIINVCTLLT
jgi:hypothetical protein